MLKTTELGQTGTPITIHGFGGMPLSVHGRPDEEEDRHLLREAGELPVTGRCHVLVHGSATLRTGRQVTIRRVNGRQDTVP